MDHWIEPQSLADSQRAGYNSPLVELPAAGAAGVQHYVNRPGQLQGEHYVNRPGQLGDVFAPGLLASAKRSAIPFVAGVVFAAVVWPHVKKALKA
jgi:hypothetical protein